MGNKQDKEIKTFSSNHHSERYNSNNKIHCHSSVKHQGPLVTNDIPKVTNQQLKHLAEHRQTPIKENPPLEQSSTSSNRNPSVEKRSRTTNPKSQPSKIVTAQQIIEKQRKHRDESSSIQKSASASAICQSSSTKSKSTHRQNQIPKDLKLMLIHPHDIKILEEVGRGNFGTVFHGLHKGTRDIALKCLHSNDGNIYRGSFDDIDPHIYELLHEANIMSKLRHPNLSRIVGITFFGDEQQLSLVTDFMKNGSLLQYLRKHQQIFLKSDHRLITKKLNHFAQQIFEAMSYLEDREIIHRDLAARNCLIGDEDILKVGDFGLTTLTECGLYKGNYRSVCAPRWTSPEAIFSSKFTSRSDVWSFGITLWELYSLGERPFATLSNARVLNVLKNPSENLSQYLAKPRPFASEETYTHLILLCLTHNFTMRPKFKDLRERLVTIFNH